MATGRDEEFLAMAIAAAREGASQGGVPIGAAIIVDNETVLSTGFNRRVQCGSSIHHGETNALENAGRQKAEVYARSTMYTTLSPCSMCTGAILLYKIPRVVIGENKTFMGSEELLRSHGVEVVVMNNAECIAMMKDFIEKNPQVWNEDIGEVDPN